MTKLKLYSVFLVLLSFMFAFILYPLMPDYMASHWNYLGNVDGYTSKFWALFMMPVISLLLSLLFVYLQNADPLKANIEKFQKYYDGFLLLIIGFLFYINILVILWNAGSNFSMNYTILPAFALFFYLMGVMLEKTKRNWFMGIRTPWSLSSDYNWEKTHRLGGLLFRFGGLLFLLSLFIPLYGFIIVVAYLIAISIFLFIYSYNIYKQEHSK